MEEYPMINYVDLRCTHLKALVEIIAGGISEIHASNRIDQNYCESTELRTIAKRLEDASKQLFERAELLYPKEN